jgi:hypothetical protein
MREEFMENIMSLCSVRSVSQSNNTLYVAVNVLTETSCLCFAYESVKDIETYSNPHIIYKISGAVDKQYVKKRLCLVETVSLFDAGEEMRHVLPECTIEIYDNHYVNNKEEPIHNPSDNMSEIREKFIAETVECINKNYVSFGILRALPNSSISECKTSEELIDLIKRFS